ncbi:MAG: FAD binding domain-containing protein [Clostridiales bacterium]|nr:FAD binding domain-containing protein [Clostridiales bacterium]
MQMQNYLQPDSLEEAYSVLNQREENVIIAGGTLLTRGDRRVNTGIDAAALLSSEVTREGGNVRIGAMTSFETLRIKAGMVQPESAAILRKVLEIGGVQLRNQITIGGTVCSKWGTSWLNTMLLALDAELDFYHSGVIPISEYFRSGYSKDILLSISIKAQMLCKCEGTAAFVSVGGQTMLNTVIAQSTEGFRVAVGGRPGIAVRLTEAENILNKAGATEDAITELQKIQAPELFGGDLCASKEYRTAICGSLIAEAAEKYYED